MMKRRGILCLFVASWALSGAFEQAGGDVAMSLAWEEHGAAVLLTRSSLGGDASAGGSERRLHEEAEEKASGASVSAAKILLGGIIVITLLFHIVNWKDADIRLYSWSIISMTLSIFIAVMIYVGTRDAAFWSLHKLVGFDLVHDSADSPNHGFRALMYYCVFVFWFCMMYCIIIYQSGIWSNTAAEGKWSRQAWVIVDPLSADLGDEVPNSDVLASTSDMGVAKVAGVNVFIQRKRPIIVECARRTNCYATLCAHIAGFANIHAAGCLQQLAFSHFPDMPAVAFVAVAVNAAMLFGCCRVSHRVRKGCNGADPVDEEDKEEEEDPSDEEELQAREVKRESCLASWSLFGQEQSLPSEKKEGPMLRYAVFGHAVEDAEDDLLSLACSFLLVQAVRVCLTGILPTIEGIEEPPLLAPWSDICWLYGISMLFCAFAGILIAMKFHGRWKHVMLNLAAMSFAWCFLWAGVWMTLRLADKIDREASNDLALESRIVLALLLSALAMLCIKVLDCFEERMHDHHQVDGDVDRETMRKVEKTVQVMITAWSILVGFSWERCFDGGIEAIASSTRHHVTFKLLLVLIVVIVLIPAWRRYILVKVVDLRTRKWIKKIASAADARNPTS